MPKILRARAAHGEKEERWVRKIAASRHEPANWIFHARFVARCEKLQQQLHQKVRSKSALLILRQISIMLPLNKQVLLFAPQHQRTSFAATDPTGRVHSARTSLRSVQDP